MLKIIVLYLIGALIVFKLSKDLNKCFDKKDRLELDEAILVSILSWLGIFILLIIFLANIISKTSFSKKINNIVNNIGENIKKWYYADW